ncbi:MAG: type IV pilus modification PilV family protein [Planctomycetota bacterium]|jgi:prepilin-type N-terminal cleavage/methylation domain-containing protein
MTDRGATGSIDGARGGFTLVEVLATLVLVAIVMPVLMEGITLSLSMAGSAAYRSRATAMAQSKLEELVLTGDWQDGNLEGDFTLGPSEEEPGADGAQPDDDLRFAWKAEVNDWQDEVKELVVTVSWERRDHEWEIALATLVYEGGE